MSNSKYLDDSYLDDEGLSYYDYETELPEHYCRFCGEPCGIVVVDDGFGYEYGSIVDTHHDYHTVSDCCGYYVGLIPEAEDQDE